ncbi:MAG TPA: metallopeptidase TldD-related protein [Candidatus Angelobacter sp.]|jgi:predicted Zn-dependent protease|nr:metallopeptidase TldD-related protein [Candidatus Angelobacter sp.]
MRKLFSILLLAAICFALPAWADDAPPSHAAVTFDDHGDPVLRAMIAELKRSQEKLQLGQLQRPYYIEYQVTELQDYTADAFLGALRTDNTNAGRLVRVVVRIGDYKQDSYFGEGTGTVDVLPMEDNEMAMRHQLWLATDKAYKAALSGFTEKQAALKNVEHEEDVPDFSQEKASQALRDTSKLGVDLGAWKGRLAATSELFRKDPALQSSSAVYSFRVLNRYFVNTEGTVTRQGRTTYNFAFAGSTQADDGMKLDRSHSYIVTRPDELPKQEEVSKDAEKLISSFVALKKAPLVEDDYRGPVLFSADATTALFERLVAPNIVGVRPELGNPARTRGEFASHYKNRVLPEFFTVVDDPKADKIDGTSLAGSYEYDDEGVPAQTVTVIDKGVLANYLVAREPIRDFPHSNGHGRTALAGSPRPQISNLIVKSANGLSQEDMKRKLLQMCKDQGRPYGYYVETTGPQLTPRLLWRVYVSDGHMELVRGAVFHELDTRALRNDIVAAGNDSYVYNRTEPVPSSIVAPSVLFGELDIQRANRTRERLPQYPAPPLAAGK